MCIICDNGPSLSSQNGDEIHGPNMIPKHEILAYLGRLFGQDCCPSPSPSGLSIPNCLSEKSERSWVTSQKLYILFWPLYTPYFTLSKADILHCLCRDGVPHTSQISFRQIAGTCNFSLDFKIQNCLNNIIISI